MLAFYTHSRQTSSQSIQDSNKEKHRTATRKKHRTATMTQLLRVDSQRMSRLISSSTFALHVLQSLTHKALHYISQLGSELHHVWATSCCTWVRVWATSCCTWVRVWATSCCTWVRVRVYAMHGLGLSWSYHPIYSHNYVCFVYFTLNSDIIDTDRELSVSSNNPVRVCIQTMQSTMDCLWTGL